jgi:hypothetical protein
MHLIDSPLLAVPRFAAGGPILRLSSRCKIIQLFVHLYTDCRKNWPK